MPRFLTSIDAWPLARRLPIAIAVVMFIVAVATTQIGLAVLEQREDRATVQKAEIFLDTLAGVVQPLGSGNPDRIETILSEAVTFKDSLRDEAVAYCCVAGDGMIVAQNARGTASDQILRDHVDTHRDLPPNASAVAFDAENGKLLVVRAYADAGAPLLLAGVFDTGRLLGERQADRRIGLLIDVALAFLAAFVTYGVTRASLRPIDRLTRQLGARSPAGAAAETFAPETTEIGRLQRAIQARLAEEEHRAELIAEASEKERDTVLARLAAGLAHEVRNPLAGLLGAVSTLRRFGADEKVRAETLDLMDRGLNTIERVAATMLSTYRPPAGDRPLTQADIDDLALLIRPEIKRRDLTYTVDGAIEEPIAIDADAVRQLLLNLLLNACQAAPEGGWVRLTTTAADDSVEFQVTDNGPGLPDSAAAVIAESDPSTVPETKRLGLWLVTKLIDDLKGRIAVQSRSGQGTTITVALPLTDEKG